MQNGRVIPFTKEPKRVRFLTQQEITRANQTKREDVLRKLDEKDNNVKYNEKKH
ncbi:hypothetical protein [Paenibacillus sp. MER 78]|nr:hypothetical protein [Paenibacillus sp. MER 78]